ncbi:MAG TPA: hypothetical protein VE090_06245 [Methylomirabilota bacterium]|nr:hypothetical protein [Methylomirabilota bacterium]
MSKELGGSMSSHEMNELKRKIEVAWKKAPVRKFTPDGLSFTASIKDAKKNAQKLDLPPDATITICRQRAKPNEILTTTPEKYADLLGVALDRGQFKDQPERIKEIAYSIVAHELAHAKPAMDDPNLSVKFGIAYRVDKATKQHALGPFIRVSGTLTVGQFKEIVSGPADDMSHRDKELVSKPYTGLKKYKPSSIRYKTQNK